MMIKKINHRRHKTLAIGIVALAVSLVANANDQQVQQCLLDLKYKDFKKAQNSCLLAANTGDAEAQLQYGSLYYFGYKEVPVDYAKTRAWIAKSAAQGNPGAEHTMGELYDFGLGVDVNKERAFNWYKKAANQRVAGAQINVGIMYFDGIGVPEDKTLGYTWVKVAVHRAGDMAENILNEMRTQLSDSQISMATKQAESILDRLYPSKP
ncbi:MAG: tetratricopeptide repeat protein [Pseudomonadales bacterium]|nr:tetratricopeptide repeat protein [Pseudomonadales bacterium]